jgi:hypothetical protein
MRMERANMSLHMKGIFVFGAKASIFWASGVFASRKLWLGSRMRADSRIRALYWVFCPRHMGWILGLDNGS